MKCWVISLFFETVDASTAADAVDMVMIFTACVAYTAKARALVRLFAFSLYRPVYFQQVYLQQRGSLQQT